MLTGIPCTSLLYFWGQGTPGYEGRGFTTAYTSAASNSSTNCQLVSWRLRQPEMALELFYALLSPNQDCPVWKSKEAFLSLYINNSFIQPTLLVIVCNGFCIRMAQKPSGSVKWVICSVDGAAAEPQSRLPGGRGEFNLEEGLVTLGKLTICVTWQLLCTDCTSPFLFFFPLTLNTL